MLIWTLYCIEQAVKSPCEKHVGRQAAMMAPSVAIPTLLPKQGTIFALRKFGSQSIQVTQKQQSTTSHAFGEQENDGFHEPLESPNAKDVSLEVDENGRQPHAAADHLARKLSTRQVQMIAIGGPSGTGLFLGTGKSPATDDPASMLILCIIVGIIVFNRMLPLGEMTAFMPVAGSFCTFAGRFVDDA